MLRHREIQTEDFHVLRRLIEVDWLIEVDLLIEVALLIEVRQVTEVRQLIEMQMRLVLVYTRFRKLAEVYLELPSIWGM